MRRFVARLAVALSAAVAVGVTSASGALAIPTDDGWTHENNDYLDGDLVVECQPDCVGWAYSSTVYLFPNLRYSIAPGLYAGAGLFASTYQDMIADYANAPTTSTGIRTQHGPYFNGPDPVTQNYQTVYLASSTLTANVCGFTRTYGNTVAEVNNGGQAQKTELSRASIVLNSKYGWSAGSNYVAGVTCNMRGTYTHELGHVVGMGHTDTTTPNRMDNDYPTGYTAGTGDKKAEKCIYELDFNPANCS